MTRGARLMDRRGARPGDAGVTAYDGRVRKDLAGTSSPTGIVVGLSVLSGAATAWLAVLLGAAVDAALGAPAGGAAAPALPGSWFMMAGTALVLAVAGTLLVPVVIDRASERMLEGTRRQLLEHYLAIGPLGLRRRGQGERVNTAMDAVDRKVRFRAGFTGPALAAVITPFVVLGFVALALDPLCAAVLGVLVLLVPLLVFGFGRLFRASSGQYRRSQGILAAVFMDALRNLGMLKLNNASSWMGAKVAAAAEAVRVQVMRLLARNQLLLLVIDASFALLLLAAAAGLAWWRVGAGVLSPGQGTALVLLSFLMLAPVNYVGSFFYIGMTGRAAQEKIAEALAEPAHPAMLQPVPVDLSASGLQLQDLAAGYERNPQAIRAVNLSFPPGSRTAVIGASGSGKSTLLRVLSGQLETTAGIVHDARQALGPATLRLNTAVVEQQAALFAMSLRENLLLADPRAEDEQLVRLLRQVGLGPWFDALDEGLDLQLGEAGARLSGGQGQRLAIARALLAERPVLLLDEPTSALDVHTEQQVLQLLRTAGQGRTVITVTHRLSLLADYDRVVVMHDGQVVQAGRREDLMQDTGGYLYRVMGQYRQRAGEAKGAR